MKKLMLLAALVCGGVQAHRGCPVMNDPHARIALTVDAIAIDNFLKPAIENRVARLAPDVHILGDISIRDIVKILSRAGVDYFWECLIRGRDGRQAATLTLLGEAGHRLLTEVLHKLHIPELFGDEERQAYRTYAAPYVKRVIAAFLHGFLATHAH